MMQLSMMMLTAIWLTVQADQACHDGMCPPKVNSLLQIGGHSTDVLQVDPTTATTTFLLADSIRVRKKCSSKGLLGLYNFGRNADTSSNNGLDVKDISALVGKGTKLPYGTTLQFNLTCTNTTNCLKIFEWCQRNNKRGITINFQECEGKWSTTEPNEVIVPLDNNVYQSPNHIDWKSMYRLELYSGPYAGKKTKRQPTLTNFTLENVRLVVLPEDEFMALLLKDAKCAEGRVVSATTLGDNQTFDEIMAEECGVYTDKPTCETDGGCNWDGQSCTVPTDAPTDTSTATSTEELADSDLEEEGFQTQEMDEPSPKAAPENLDDQAPPIPTCVASEIADEFPGRYPTNNADDCDVLENLDKSACDEATKMQIFEFIYTTLGCPAAQWTKQFKFRCNEKPGQIMPANPSVHWSGAWLDGGNAYGFFGNPAGGRDTVDACAALCAAEVNCTSFSCSGVDAAGNDVGGGYSQCRLHNVSGGYSLGCSNTQYDTTTGNWGWGFFKLDRLPTAQAGEVTLAFYGPNKSDKSGWGGTPNGWTFSDSDPTTGSVACNSWKYGPSYAWYGSDAPITAHLAFDGVDQLDWRNVDQFESDWNVGPYDASKRITQYSYSKGGEDNNWDFLLNFCNSVTLQQVILVPLRASYNITYGTLQYKDASGAWQDAGVNGETKTGIGFAWQPPGYDAANYRVFGAASTSSKYWRVTSIKSNNHFSGAQVKVA